MRALFLDSPLLFGWLPTTLTWLGIVSLVFLLVRFRRGWWTRRLPLVVAITLVVLGAAAVALQVLQPFPDPLGWRVWLWSGLAVLALVAAVAGRRRWWRLLSVLAVVLVLVTAGIKINAVYAYRPTLAGVFGLPAANAIDFAAVPAALPVAAPGPDGSVEAGWVAPADLPGTGRVATVPIPGTVSGFAARPAEVYLPPAYLVSPRPLLPVLVLVGGQPGDPADWLVAGELAKIMDAFARAHAGLAPIVVVPDATGSAFADPLCLDSRLGNVQTYLAEDVPAWVATHLQADPNRRAIGGFSYGGTCSLQLAANRPDVYPTFLDMSGQVEPSLGTREQTVAAAFGDRPDPLAAFRAVNPLEHLPPGIAGRVVVGREDEIYGPQARRVVDAARAAGLDVTLSLVAGTHSWTVAKDGLVAELPWIARRTGLLPDIG
ncbi:alpha/beta hydrolase [Pseudonocardia xishanensis]|uniref:Alpha/beta hydrolase-fold protein n=1 Tax=Pseudonocardia xishanensis TaxID=630995 RepID=A0ABP8RX41_9PSEU